MATLKFIQLIAPVTFTDRKSKAGNSYRAADVQGIVHNDDGTQEVFAFMLMSPYKEQGKDLPAGNYIPDTAFKVDFRDRKPVFEIVGFKPLQVEPAKRVA